MGRSDIDVVKADRQKVYIDVSIMKKLLFLTGIQRVVKEIILQLYRYDDIDLIFLDYDDKRREFEVVDNNKFMKFLRKANYNKISSETRKYIAPGEIGRGAVFFELDAVWMCRMKRSYLYPILKEHGVRIVVHIYDIICITHPQFFEEMLVYKFMDYLGAAIQYADKIICNDHATEADLIEVPQRVGIACPEIEVVPLGADFTERAIDEAEIPADVKAAVNGNPYILMVGTIEPRKNHKLLLDSYDEGLKDLGYNIIFAGTPGWKNDEFMSRLTGHRDFGKRIFLLSKQPDIVIDYLYKNAKYVAFLSYKEGYGLPIIEALAKGVPVIASDTPINKEIGGDNCIYFRQDDTSGLISAVADTDEGTFALIKHQLAAFRYPTWDESGQKMKDALI